MSIKKVLSVIAVILLVIALLYFFRYFKGKGAKNVGFEKVEPENIPTQINEVLPNYRIKEKALVARINDEIFVVVTRGEKSSAGFDVDINKITLDNVDGENVLTVFAQYTDPKPGDVTAQILTYPFVVVKTDLTELPQKVILEKEYSH